MKARYLLFRRTGIYYTEDTLTRKQHGLRTRDKADALKILNAKNEPFRQLVLNCRSPAPT